MYNIIDKDMVDTAIQHISQVYDNNKQVNLYTISLIKTYRSISLSQSPREWRKYFELSEVRHSQK